MRDVECRRIFDRVFWFVGVRSCFLSEWATVDESVCGFWATLVSNNRERTEELPRDVVEGYEDIVAGPRTIWTENGQRWSTNRAEFYGNSTRHHSNTLQCCVQGH